MKIRKKGKILLIVMLFVITLIVCLYGAGLPDKDSRINISVISRSQYSEQYAAIKLGMDQAAADEKAIVSYANLSQEDSVEDQKRLLRREADNGADAIVLMPADSEQMADIAQEIDVKTPIVTVESYLTDSSDIIKVVGDDKEMGRQLGIEILKMGISQKKVGILLSSENRQNIMDRADGIRAVIKGGCQEVIYYRLPANQDEWSGYISNLIKTSDMDVLVGTESSVLESAAQVISTQQTDRTVLYGVGVTNKIISYLESGVVEGIVVQNDYNMGYVAMAKAVGEIRRKTVYKNYTINYSYVSQDTIYTQRNQTLLFPFVR